MMCSKISLSFHDIVPLTRNYDILHVLQVLLRGIETQGYVIMSAARASVSQNLHRPVWKERALLSKTTWSGGLESMQYYATVRSPQIRLLVVRS